MASPPSFGFVVLRYVHSAETNRYWNVCVQQLDRHYPGVPVVVIDDQSPYPDLTADRAYPHVTVLSSEFPQRGEWLPYLAFLKHRWWPRAVFLHDSVFVQRRVPFEAWKGDVLPLWHHPRDGENQAKVGSLVQRLRNADGLRARVHLDPTPLSSWQTTRAGYALCFGGMAMVSWAWWKRVADQYDVSRLTDGIRTRADRCALERVLGALFWEESPALRTGRAVSWFGDIFRHPHAFRYRFVDYERDVGTPRLPSVPFVKVWTGR